MTSVASTNTGGIGTGNPASVSAIGRPERKEARPIGRPERKEARPIGRASLRRVLLVGVAVAAVTTIVLFAVLRVLLGLDGLLRGCRLPIGIVMIAIVVAGLVARTSRGWRRGRGRGRRRRRRCRRGELDGQAGEVDLDRTKGVDVDQLH